MYLAKGLQQKYLRKGKGKSDSSVKPPGPSQVRAAEMLEDGQRVFRLLTIIPNHATDGLICCSTQIYPVDHAPPYRALSYVWGKDTEDYAVLVDRRIIEVRGNLYALLHYLAKSACNSLLWIDALCINQSILKERNHQVRLMGSIYENATSLIVWLGPEVAEYEGFATDLEFLCGNEHIYNYQTLRQRYNMLVNKGAMQRFWDFLVCFYLNMYWSRTWILQEISLAKDVSFIVSNREVLCDDLSWICRALPVVATESGSSVGQWRRDVLGQWRRDVLSPYVGRVLHVLDGKSEGKSKTLEGILITAQMTDCTDVRDRVFGVLGFAKDCSGNNGMQADYSWNTSRLFDEVMLFCRPKEKAIFHRKLEQLLEIKRDSLFEQPKLMPPLSALEPSILPNRHYIPYEDYNDLDHTQPGSAVASLRPDHYY